MSIEAPIGLDGDFFAGEDKMLRFDITDEDGSPLPLTGRLLVWVLQTSRTSFDRLIRKTNDDILLDDTVVGRCRVPVSGDDTKGLEAGKYWHILVCVDPGNLAVLSEGDVELQARPNPL